MLGLSALGLAAIAGYVYVGFAAGRAEAKGGSGIMKAALKAATWPFTIWSTINQLYLKRPE